MITHKNIYAICFLLLCVIIIADIIIGIAFVWYLLHVVILLIALAVGSFNMGGNFYFKAFTHNPNIIDKRITITFDDGPNLDYTPQVLKLLAQYNATATFFCIGKNIKSRPEIFKQIHTDGHSVGNHSYSHSNFIGFHSAEQWVKEIEHTDKIIEDIIGNKTRLFRPPFGVTTPNLKQAIRISGHLVIGWNVRSFDTVIKNKNFLLWRIKRKVKPGSVVLLHDTHNRIEYVLEHLLQFLQENKYKTVSVEELIDEK